MREKLQVQEIDRARARKENVYKEKREYGMQESKTARASARDRQGVYKGKREYV